MEKTGNSFKVETTGETTNGSETKRWNDFVKYQSETTEEEQNCIGRAVLQNEQRERK